MTDKLFRAMKAVEYIEDNGFIFQWCCGCHLRHIWHLEIEKDKRGKKWIKVSIVADDVATKLRRSYLRRKKKK